MKRVIRASRNARFRNIRAADDPEKDTRFDDLAGSLKDDFDYALDGFDKLARDGNVEGALQIMNTLSAAINNAIEENASQMSN